ncbi:E3 ubiquitin-protein ligase RNF217 [Symphalangus syndactylus]|uniref:E3 ubiquitin-protein ligase RNF217 n=1 Tax=Symphalangus syndactylus TaxID=9590 RepID=UPI002442B8C6|nr:E3 ubiquitin-protein ligase RNF217 [Symphalangus syndactylus]
MSFLRTSVRWPASPAPRRPYLPPLGPRLCAEAQRAGGGNAGRRKRRAGRKGPSPERSPLQLQPRAPSLFPAPQMRRWRRKRQKEAPVLQRHLALQHRPPRAEEDSGGAAAAGSIGARSPRAERAAGPAPSRRSEMRGRAPGCPITARRPPCPPRACLPVSRR